MKRLFNYSSLLICGLAICFSLIATVPVSGIASAIAAKDSPFCTNLATKISAIDFKLSDLRGKLTDARSQRDQQLVENRAKWDQSLNTERANWANKRQEQFALLQTKATNDVQKAAVQVYETTISGAITARQAANDIAMSTFRSAEDGLITTQRATIDGQVTTFVDSVNTAESNAQTSCQNTPSQGATIRTTFVNAMKNARQIFSGERASDEKLSDQIKVLARTRDAAIQANNDIFKVAAQAAASALKAVFGSASGI